jgi:selenide,water dikinase
MGPQALAQVLRPLADMFDPGAFPDLLQGLATPDDAAVWRLDGERALVVTADFFPPVVDDPHSFGAIAAANALSDLYAMGAAPLFGLNLVGYPEDGDPQVLSEILRGGGEKVREAGAAIAGGHTTTDREPKYGLAVVGLVHPDRVFTKGGARPGDALFLTKPLGTGILTTAHKQGEVDEDDLAAAIASMSRLSAGASRIAGSLGAAIHAVTDVTGFSLVGHAHEMAHQSGLALRLRWEALGLLPGVERYARAGYLTGGARRNREFYEPYVSGRALEPWCVEVLYDPQTSGGLLIAVAGERAADLATAFAERGEPLWRIGEAVPGAPGRIEL